MRYRLSSFLLMHFAFLVYSMYAIFGKIAARKSYFTKEFFLFYGIAFFVMVIYAFLWQKVLKVFPLTIAVANKSITIIWGIIFGKIIFHDMIKPNMIIGAIIIITGILVLSFEKESVK